jgi:pectate lyase
MKAIISKAARRKWAWVLALVMVVSIVIPTSLLTVKADVGTVKFIDGAAGWLESAYAQWSIDNQAEGYTAYIKKASQSDSAYARIDNELIRKYKNYYRVDAVGLAAGDYVIKVVPVKNGKEVTDKAQVTKTLNVSSYDRSGFAFSSESKYKTGSGAYNEDGTLKKDAIVLYVTNDNAKTIKASVKEAKGEKEYTGLQTIIDAYTKSASKGIETRALDVRVIGCVTDAAMDKFSSSSEGVQIKGASAYSNLNMTIEGIGNDATINGFGFLLRNAGNVEMRNFSIINFMDDGISLDTANCNVWIHNVDLYYGKAGGDADQAKGDGSIDIKGNSQYITVSYVHFYDSGKCSLCGMKSESGPNYITYHHNWFDHSDSRHARVRTMSVHMYNNYYDGNAKYGAGSTMGSSLFIQNNYFNNCKYPMLSSKQGSDALGEGTFSGENGGIIKASGNVIVGAQKIIYANAVSETGDSANAASFDAYLAKSADEKVPSSYKTVAGGTSYDNFDTTKDLGVKSGSLNNAEDVPSVVTSSKGAGSLGRGVIDWKFTDADNDDYSVNKELKATVTNYRNTSLVSVGGVKGTVVAPEQPTKSTEATTKDNETTKAEETTKETAATGATHTYIADNETNDSYFSISESLKSIKATYNGKTYSKAVKLDSKGSIAFKTTTDNATLSILVSAKKSDSSVKVNDDVLFSNIGTSVEYRTVELGKAGTYVIKQKKNENYIYMVVVTEKGQASTESSTKATEATTKATEATTKATEATTKNEETTKETEAITKNEETTKETQTPSVPSEAGEYDSKSLSYSGAYTDISTKKDSEFKNAKYVSTSEEIRAAIDNAKAGDVIIIKEGTYKFDSIESLMATDDKGKTGAPALYITNNGVADNYIILKAEYGKSVKFDFSSQKLASFNRGLIHYADYWYFEGINFYHAGDNGVLLSGNNNIFEKCVFEANRDTGLQIARKDANAQPTKDTWPSNNLIINCTSFNNVDPVDEGGNGENADGFAAKLTCGEGNVFDGCISYCNSDDGWDLYAKPATGSIGVVTIRNCIAYGNGKLSDGSGEAAGDMNGFKLGGSNKAVPTPHVVLNCLALNNGACGFTDNGNGGALTIMNCTSVANGKYAKKSNFTFYRSSSDSMYMGLVSVNDTDSDKFVGKMLNSIYFNSKKYYRISGMIPTVMASGDRKGDVVSNPSGISGMFINTNNTIDTNKNIDSQIRNADGTINVKGLYETTGEYATMGAHFSAANQIIKVLVNTNVKEDETKTEETSSSQETTKATQAPTKATEATTKETQAPTKATEATTKETQAPTKATEATTQNPTTAAPTEAAGKKLVLNANDMTAGDINSSIYADGFKIIASADSMVSVDSNSKSYNGKNFKQRIKLGGTGTTTKRAIEFKTAGASTVTVYAMSSSSKEARKLQILDKDGKVVASLAELGGKNLASATFNIKEAGEYYLAGVSGGVNVYYVEVSNGIALTGSTEAPTTKPTVAPTEAPTTKPTVAPTEAPTTKPTVAPTEAPTTEPTVAPTTKPTQAAESTTEAKRAEIAADEEKITNSQVETVASDTTASAKTPEVAADETKTGDASHMMMYVIIFISALAVFTGVAVVSKRRRVK